MPLGNLCVFLAQARTVQLILLDFSSSERALTLGSREAAAWLFL